MTDLKVIGTTTAWNLIGFEGSEWDIERALGVEWSMGGRTDALVRVKGGRTLYENVDYNDSTPGDKVRLAYLRSGHDGLHLFTRWVDGDTILEVLAPGPESTVT
jgi:hypothetical protein